MLMFEEYQDIMIFVLKDQSKWPIAKKKKIKLWDALTIINMICKKIWSLRVYNMYTYMPQTNPHKCI